jgi:hypothetical protein
VYRCSAGLVGSETAVWTNRGCLARDGALREGLRARQPGSSPRLTPRDRLSTWGLLTDARCQLLYLLKDGGSFLHLLTDLVGGVDNS